MDIKDGEIRDTASYGLLLELAAASGVDAQALREEMLPLAAEAPPVDPVPSPDPAPLATKKGKKKPAVAEETKSDIPKSWPFPTAESIAAAKAAGEVQS